jgi:hypothetical protein
LQRSQERLNFKARAERPKHNQIRPEFPEHGPDIGCIGFARDEAKLVEHIGKKHPHMSPVLNDAGPWRNRSAAELDNLSPVLLAVVVGHGAALTNSSRSVCEGAYDIHRLRAPYAILHNPPNDSFRG